MADAVRGIASDAVRGIGTGVVEVIGTGVNRHVGIGPSDAIAFPLLPRSGDNETAALAGPWARREARAPTLTISRWISS